MLIILLVKEIQQVSLLLVQKKLFWCKKWGTLYAPHFCCSLLWHAICKLVLHIYYKRRLETHSLWHHHVTRLCTGCRTPERTFWHFGNYCSKTSLCSSFTIVTGASPHAPTQRQTYKQNRNTMSSFWIKANCAQKVATP